MAYAIKSANTGYAPIEGIKYGYQWNTGNLTYSFPTGGHQYSTGSYGYHNENQQLVTMSDTQKAYIRDALAQWASVANITFTELAPGQGDIRFGLTNYNAGAPAWTYTPEDTTPGGANGDVWFDPDYISSNPIKGSYSYNVIMHEIGHALGLDHAHDGPRGAMPAAHDHLQATVMSYRSYQGDALGYNTAADGFPQSPMQFDIYAIQSIYGVNYNHQAGDSSYYWDLGTGQKFINGVGHTDALGTSVINETIWDGGGNDTFNFYGEPYGIVANLNAGGSITLATNRAKYFDGSPFGTTVPSNIYLAYDPDGSGRNLIENIHTGSGADNITGNQAGNNILTYGGNDVIFGGAGGDYITAGEGNDLIYGESGNDMLSGGSGADSFIFAPGLGYDTIVDLQQGTDKIYLNPIDANVHVAGDQAFTLRGNRAFTGAVGDLITWGSYIQGDTNGDAVADFTIGFQIASGSSLRAFIASDFVL
jgi:serralysin